MEQAEQGRRVQEALARLSPEHRAVPQCDERHGRPEIREIMAEGTSGANRHDSQPIASRLLLELRDLLEKDEGLTRSPRSGIRGRGMLSRAISRTLLTAYVDNGQPSAHQHIRAAVASAFGGTAGGLLKCLQSDSRDRIRLPYAAAQPRPLASDSQKRLPRARIGSDSSRPRRSTFRGRFIRFGSASANPPPRRTLPWLEQPPIAPFATFPRPRSLSTGTYRCGSKAEILACRIQPFSKSDSQKIAGTSPR